MLTKPDCLRALYAWLSAHHLELCAVSLSFFIAVLRAIYRRGGLVKVVIEGMICGSLTLTLISALEFFNLPSSMAIFVGGCVGFLGVRKISNITDHYFNIKSSKRPE